MWSAKFWLEWDPSNIGLIAKVSISRRRNSLFGPPKSTASSFRPRSSENLMFMVALGLYVARLKPRKAPSKTAERFILNLKRLFGEMFSANSKRISLTETFWLRVAWALKNINIFKISNWISIHTCISIMQVNPYTHENLNVYLFFCNTIPIHYIQYFNEHGINLQSA